ncbi:peptide/nickel transport system permease protein [Phyllobacterium trifolii]|jgi:peptide/nickel transport system permease protein|uniref:Peptide/nickel transport system permease protein n=1 Tax=Phyllobacterium trifolii TaxID=300193 RepID=A0A839U5Z2_9HYPH|nr:ABC transporter permease [Phyllobacterium trifolii]MBB3146536.1 peptide/nickel transport system permease protein [Phyllobacterium trifolii]
MLTYATKRALIAILTLLAASLVVFAMLEIVPGDPARLMLGMNATEDAVHNLQEQMGLNQPLAIRYFSWLGGLLTGDLGKSYTYSVPVFDLIKERVAVSLPLAVISLALSTLIALPVGIFAASKRGKFSGTLAMGVAQVGVAIPNFWFALLLVYLFAVTLRLVPAGGFPGWGAGFGVSLKSLILPSIALALPQAAILARVTRSALLEVLGEDYIRTARAKGLSRRQVLYRHALRNALIPVLTILGLQFAFLLAGTIIIENVFYLPGLGRLVFQAITQRDLIVVEGVVMLLIATLILVNLLVDLSYAIVDPRLRGRS